MTHRELVAAIAARLGVTQVGVEAVFSEAVQLTHTTLKMGGSVTVSGLGSFVIKRQAARKARNPRTGAMISVPAKKVPALKVSDAFTRGAV